MVNEIAQRVVHLSTVHALQDPRIFYKELNSLKKAGYSVVYIVQHIRQETLNGIEIIPLPKPKNRLHRLLLQRTAYREAKKQRAVLYHFHDPELIPLAYWLKKSTKAKVVYDKHENYTTRKGWQGLFLKALEKWCASWIDEIVLAFQPEQQQTIKHLGDKLTVIENYYLPHSDKIQSPKKIDGQSLMLIYTGVMGKVRGLFTYLEIAQKLQTATIDASLQLVGQCKQEKTRKQFEVQSKSVNTLYRMGWETFVPFPEMLPFYQKAHVGLCLLAPLPNYQDTIPTKFYEYMAFGIPIICSDFPRWKAFVEEQGIGTCVSYNDATAVIEIVQQWQQNPEIYQQMSERALALVPKFYWKHMEVKLRDLYQKMLHKRT